MGDSSGEKTEEPTPERLRKLRKEGNVAKSQDINTAASFIVTFTVLAGTFGTIAKEMVDFYQTMVAAGFSEQPPATVIHRVFVDAMKTLGMATWPVLLAAFVMGIAGNMAQVGFLFTTKPITPDIKKLNPVQGVKNLVNMKKVVELIKTVLKFSIVSILSFLALRDAIRDVSLIIRSDLEIGIQVIGSIIWDFCIKIGAAFVLIALVDAFYQRKRYIKDNMMSKHDVKQEFKQSEGDPQHKAERKKFHQEIINSSSPSNVKEADAVVRNPDHIAVAIKYDQEKGNAPEVVAKGERVHAEKILEAAKRYGVPVVRNVPLAQALNKLDVGEEIPEELYEAVAEVLNFVYQLAEKQRQKGR